MESGHPQAVSVPPSPAATDVEAQLCGSVARWVIQALHTLVLIMNGYHVFCASALYSTPYALMEGGWVGIFLLVLYWFCAYHSSVALGRCMAAYPSHLPNYHAVGRHAYGWPGLIIVLVNEHLVTLAGCVGSVTLVCQAAVYGFPKFIAFIDNQSKWMIIIAVIVLIIPVTIICQKVNVERSDLYLTVLGTILNILVVACLVWLRYVNGVTENTSTTKYVIISGLPTASGLFGYCFAGHPYLPILYGSIKTNENTVDKYITIVRCFFVPCLLTYGSAAIFGYSMFGENVKSVYLLNLPLEYRASVVAVIAMVAHQFIRFFMGVHAMEESLYSGLIQNRSGNHNNYIRIILKGVIVTIIVPLCFLVPAYGPLMAFLGSFLGIVVVGFRLPLCFPDMKHYLEANVFFFQSLIIPCVCSFGIRWERMSKSEVYHLTTILVLASFAAIAGMVSSFPQMRKMQWGFVKFGKRS